MVRTEMKSLVCREDETEAVNDLILQNKNRGSVFFSNLLYAISRQHFAPDIAETLWHRILSHESLISGRLGRNVGTTVATMDYLSNIARELRFPTPSSEAYVSEMAGLAMRDGMTGLFTYSTCYELLELELRNYRRHGVGVSLLLLDVDDFKSVNDRKGHREGDRILVELAKTLTVEARDTDLCCRLGGDDFVVILRRTNDVNEAYETAERMRARAATIPCSGQTITVSVGAAVCDQAASSPRTLMERADRALRRAKTTGKNQVLLGGQDHTASLEDEPPAGAPALIAEPRACRQSGPNS